MAEDESFAVVALNHHDDGVMVRKRLRDVMEVFREVGDWPPSKRNFGEIFRRLDALPDWRRPAGGSEPLLYLELQHPGDLFLYWDDEQAREPVTRSYWTPKILATPEE